MAPPSGLNGFPDCPGGDFFVKLLGYSKFAGLPGPARDGRFYTILELGEERLDQWLSKTKKSMPKVWALTGFADVARALFSALHHLHTRGLVHLDIKPENIMRFGTCWKLIDLECCMQIDAGTFVSIDDITPLYASPELAQAAIAAYKVGATTLLPPTSAMDIWAAGVAGLKTHWGWWTFCLPHRPYKLNVAKVMLLGQVTDLRKWYGRQLCVALRSWMLIYQGCSARCSCRRMLLQWDEGLVNRRHNRLLYV